ncbi:aspartyl-phosphate phosphatase Spo0E family protein [Paenibacillus glycanilyticus]|uniref:aspartyl-phosphate phosphatase Spo0E family protein n=1 Tax=Paenibacillus glycanilyticus TaxID=126569 RepID=UPI00203BF738|nr:aspartyl-phosphate phosphatase Spo0E family protein [Paenibacillus glycanilyticus]MCM3627382.1 aspartyl-phosphate phosphatase Spo0E family protein [Paenibacillus glycanilyticus]
MDKQLLIEIEQLRGKMVEKAMKKKTFVHREVLQLSQMLDELIVREQVLRARAVK